jgi:MFS family permease
MADVTRASARIQHPPGRASHGSSGSVAFMLRALRHRNYRLFFGGQIVSLAGTWITTTATSWIVYRLTGSALLLGFVGFAGQFPAFLLGPFAGIFIDRWDRRRLLVATQTISMLQSFALAALTFSGHITVGAIVVLSILQGIVNAFDMPGRQSFLFTMIEDKRDLSNAIALNSSMVNVARLVGPSIAGVVIAATNEGWCF